MIQVKPLLEGPTIDLETTARRSDTSHESLFRQDPTVLKKNNVKRSSRVENTPCH